MTTLDLGARARAIVAAPSDDASHGDERALQSSTFYVPTNALREANALRVITLSADTRSPTVSRSVSLEHRACEDIDVDASGSTIVVAYEHVGLETRRTRGAATVSASTGTTTDLRLNPGISASEEREFETVKCAKFNANTGGLATVDEFKFRSWSRRDDGAFACASAGETRSDGTRSEVMGGMNTTQDGVGTGSWDPHGGESFACGVDADVVVFDARSGGRAQTIERAHVQQTRDVQHNPNRPHEMMTCGDDGLLKFWDARAHERALKVVSGHEHWIWRCAYNPVYDALTLTASSDGTTRVWCDDDALPNDSKPSKARRDRSSSVRCVARRVARDSVSVRACAWSSADPWTHASVAADGLVTFNDIPREEKYRILL